MSTERSVHDAAEPQRRRSRLAVASVAATVLLVGGGGAYFAATATGGSGSSNDGGAPAGDGGAPPPLALDGYTDGDRSGGTGGIAPGEPDPNGAAYRAEGKLPDGPDSAAVYHARGTVGADQVTELARALGVEGKPTSRDGAWRIGPAKDGSGPSLQVSKQAPGTWTFTQYATGGTDNCQKGKPCSGTSTAPNGSGDAVGESAAKKAAAPVLKALGQDDAKLDARQLMGAVRVVNADPKVGGLPTYGWSTGIQVGSDGQVVGGSGQLKAPEKGATYPVTSADETLKQLNKSGKGDGRVGIGGCATAVPDHATGSGEQPAPGNGQQPAAGDGDKQTAGDDDKRTQAPCEPSSAPPKPQPITVKGATFGLAVQFVDGRQALVPSWLFEVKPQGAQDSFTVTHPAVEPKFLTSPSTPTPKPTPTPSGKPGENPTLRVESYSADGKSLTLHFWGGVCSDYSASAEESKGSVSVKVTETHKKGEVCIMIAKEFTETVTLDAPLGDRKVVDAAGGETVPRK
ncbi:hypothetical protein [Streptomyces sp. MZ04]|uniref:hypothetical protein n=1 Tax=Streptomyces sp. MZ04 TaxID=2559236 RepID=UPI00107EAB43|nr:hypothetical protein [Streptomyces sp. MZ04]TGB16279.1 hypothetical protein E2651_00340 [Streptomyces sp. MZ04]